MYYVGVDVGGTSIKTGIVNEKYEIIARSRQETFFGMTNDEFCERIARSIDEVLQNAGLNASRVEQIGIGCPGNVNDELGIFEHIGNLGLKNVEVKKALAKRYPGTKVIIDNDANAAAYGEYLAGALKGSSFAVAVTLGTGIGGGIIADGKIYRSYNYYGGEVGHTVIHAGGRSCRCGRNGCWEAYASATGLTATTKEVMEEHPDSLMWALAENDIEKVKGSTAFTARKQGDNAAKKVAERFVDDLAVGLANITNVLQPKTVCIGGGISEQGDWLINMLREKYEAEIALPSRRAEIIEAKLGNSAGIIGSAFLV